MIAESEAIEAAQVLTESEPLPYVEMRGRCLALPIKKPDPTLQRDLRPGWLMPYMAQADKETAS